MKAEAKEKNVKKRLKVKARAAGPKKQLKKGERGHLRMKIKDEIKKATTNLKESKSMRKGEKSENIEFGDGGEKNTRRIK